MSVFLTKSYARYIPSAFNYRFLFSNEIHSSDPLGFQLLLILFRFCCCRRCSCLLFFHLLNLGSVPLVFLALGVQIVQIEDLDHLVFLEEELLNLPVVDGGRPSDLLAVLKHDDRGELARQGRSVDVVLFGNFRITADIDFP